MPGKLDVCPGYLQHRLHAIREPFVSPQRYQSGLLLTVSSLGTENGGNMFPGVAPAPFSMVKLGPDVEDGTTDAYSASQIDQ